MISVADESTTSKRAASSRMAAVRPERTAISRIQKLLMHSGPRFSAKHKAPDIRRHHNPRPEPCLAVQVHRRLPDPQPRLLRPPLRRLLVLAEGGRDLHR